MLAVHSLLTCILSSTTIAAAYSIQKLIHTPQVNISPQDSSHSFNTIKGPLITENFPDPCVIFYDGVTYAFATNNRRADSTRINVQIASSRDNVTWEVWQGVDALPKPATWQTGEAVWAPDVKQRPDGSFILYYTDSLRHQPQTHCIGAATSQYITGPYTPLDVPYICPYGGAIDPAGFLDRSSGKRYIVYKIDGNSLGHGGSCNNGVEPIVSTPIMLQEVDPLTALDFIGDPVKILDRDARDGPLVEAPTMYLSPDGIYFLFYASNCFTSPDYATNYATASNVAGPYTKAADSLLRSDVYPGLAGPGGMDIIHHSYADQRFGVYNDTSRLVLFHGILQFGRRTKGPVWSQRFWDPKPLSKYRTADLVRGMYSAQVYFKGHTVSIDAPVSVFEEHTA